MYLQDELERLAEMRAIDSDEGVANSLMRVAIAYLDKGKYDLAAEPLDEAYYLCRKLENHAGRAQVCLRLADVATAGERFDQARQHLAEAEEVFAAQDDLAGLAGAAERRGRLELKAGDPAGAARAWEEALAMVRRADDQVGELLLTQYLAGVYRQMGRHDQALEAYRNLGRLADRAGDPQRVALALVGMATLLAAMGRRDQARQAFEQAGAVYRELGQVQRAEQVKQEMERLLSADQ